PCTLNPEPSSDCDRAQRKSSGSAFDFVRLADVGEFVGFVPGEVFQVVEFADVDALFHQQVIVNGIEAPASLGSGPDLQTAGIGGEQNRPLLANEPFGGIQVDS